MDKKVFISRLKMPTPSTSTLSTNRPVNIRRSKSVADLRCRVASRVGSPIGRNLPLTKNTLTFNAPTTAPLRPPLKSRENTKPAPKRPGPAIDADDRIKPKAAKPAPYDYKARYNLLNEKHSNLLQSFKNNKQQLAETEIYREKYNKIENEHEELQSRYTQVSNERDKYKIDYYNAITNWNNLETEHERLRHDCVALSEKFHTLEDNYNRIIAANILLESQLTNAHKKLEDQTTLISDYKKETQAHDELRRNLHNQIQDLKGTIRVFCRIRPSLYSENSRLLCSINCLDENTLEIKKTKESMNNITGKNQDSRLEFTFDKVFPGEASQKAIFEELAQLVQSALDGYHVCVFAYGQTGSGKTYTMQGECTEEALGMIPRSVILIFELLRNLERQGWNYVIECNFLEIYNETIRDLLHPNSKLQYDIHFNEGRGITVTNITNKTVKCAKDLLQLIEIANRNRAIAVTNFNEHSSRSHAVTRITLHGENKETATSYNGSLNLVDLAGSESAKTSCTERLTETKNINRSLSMLGTVICALHNKETHIPYRNSKLTYLLQSSLCGNAKALMFVNIAPLEECYGESISSLRFAAQVKEIKINAKRNKLYLKKDQ